MDIEVIKKSADLMQQANSLLGKGPLEFYLREMAAAYDMMMQRYAPFKVGDRVALLRAPELEKDHGWYCARHFLIEGALATVKEADCGSRGFRFALQFDNDSWVDHAGVIHPMKDPYLYPGFGENDIVKWPTK